MMSTPSTSAPRLNRYGQMAWDHWRRWRPRMLAGIEDPQTFFSTLGRQTEQEIDQLADQIAGPDRPGETMLQKTARLREARLSAESDLLPLRITLPAEDADQEEPTSQLGHWVEEHIQPDDPIEMQHQQTHHRTATHHVTQETSRRR